MILTLKQLQDYTFKFINNKHIIVFIKGEANIKTIRESIKYHIERLHTSDRRIASSINYSIQSLKRNLTYEEDSPYIGKYINSYVLFDVIRYLLELEERIKFKEAFKKAILK